MLPYIYPSIFLLRFRKNVKNPKKTKLNEAEREETDGASSLFSSVIFERMEEDAGKIGALGKACTDASDCNS